MSKDQLEQRIDEIQAALVLGTIDQNEYPRYRTELLELSDKWSSHDQEGGEDNDTNYHLDSIRYGIGNDHRGNTHIRGRLF